MLQRGNKKVCQSVQDFPGQADNRNLARCLELPFAVLPHLPDVRDFPGVRYLFSIYPAVCVYLLVYVDSMHRSVSQSILRSVSVSSSQGSIDVPLYLHRPIFTDTFL